MINSGLYEELKSKDLIITHEEINNIKPDGMGWKIIKPYQVPFFSYPYEWSFSMLKDAALTTLEIQKIAIKHGMILKDASAFNIQFVEGKMKLIDSLSFEKYDEGKPWIAYKQFTEHFLTPLALMNYEDVRLIRLFSIYPNGIPVDLAASMLPLKSRVNLKLLFHIFAHASTQKKYSDKKIENKIKEKKFSKRSLLGLIDSLESSVKSMKWNPKGTQWEDYYDQGKNNYTSTSHKHKAELVETYIKEIKPKTVWDMGANTGMFSNIAAKQKADVVAFDIDFGALEKGYLSIKNNGIKNINPVFSDLTNPTPGVGWENEERSSLFDRGPADCVLALALIHHLVFPHNVPFSHLATCFSKLGKNLIIEFIEKSDSQIQILLANREDIFDGYNQINFEDEFKKYFTIKKAIKIKDSKRTLYLMQRKNA